MRVSIFNCCSTAVDMLKFSSTLAISQAGIDDWDYIVVLWLPSKEVIEYAESLVDSWGYLPSGLKVHVLRYETNSAVGYVPNLRGMINAGFLRSYELNDYAGLINTDMCFGSGWLKNLVRYATPNAIVNSVHITPKAIGRHVVTADCGITEFGKFDFDKFGKLYDKLYQDRLETEDQRGGWKNTNTMPYLIHRDVWIKCGPWGLHNDRDTPDRRFFQQCSDLGIKFTMSHGSIVYHMEGAERSGTRPIGTEAMTYDA